MKTGTIFRQLLGAMLLSVGAFTMLSLLYFVVNGAAKGFALINPFAFNSNMLDSDLESFFFYLLVGLFVQTAIWLFRFEKFGLTRLNLLHFLATVVLLFLTSLSTSFPWGLPLREVWPYYAAGPSSMLWTFLVDPILLIVTGYLLVWLLLWVSYHRQIRQLNQKLQEKRPNPKT
jgi:hypothetical protein